jgi:hypothetical protein
MGFARHPALIATFLALLVVATALSWPRNSTRNPTANPEVSTEMPLFNGAAINGPVQRVDLPLSPPPFRCDSLAAKDCFEMFQRYQSSMAITTVPAQHFLNRVDRSANEPADCALNARHRGDRCPIRDNR